MPNHTCPFMSLVTQGFWIILQITIWKSLWNHNRQNWMAIGAVDYCLHCNVTGRVSGGSFVKSCVKLAWHLWSTLLGLLGQIITMPVRGFVSDHDTGRHCKSNQSVCLCRDWTQCQKSWTIWAEWTNLVFVEGVHHKAVDVIDGDAKSHSHDVLGDCTIKRVAVLNHGEMTAVQRHVHLWDAFTPRTLANHT